MAKGMYHYLGEAWKKSTPALMRERLIEWRAGNSVVKLDKPTRLDKARMIGYKDKKGIVVARVRVLRGGRKRSRHTHGRKSRKQHVRKILKMNYRWVAELRAAKKFPNLEVLNSYNTGKDGKYFFFEVILVDPQRHEIQNDPVYSWIADKANRGRVYRGLTSAGKKSRGLRSKSRNMKVRPSLRAWNRQGK
jgi:large subunit ribosomal protein L15e